MSSWYDFLTNLGYTNIVTDNVTCTQSRVPQIANYAWRGTSAGELLIDFIQLTRFEYP